MIQKQAIFLFLKLTILKGLKKKGIKYFNMKTALMSIDVEDWFHTRNFLNLISKSEWDALPSRVEESTNLILDILAKHDAKGTFFVLGWVAKKKPALVKRIKAEGHEVASHGFGHDCIYDLKPDEFREDIRISTEILENLVGEKVIGYRAPNFSITDWAIDILREFKFEYDSSWFPTIAHDRYGKLERYKVEDKPIFKLTEDFYEVPMSTLKSFGKNIPWSGGGYFRLYPYSFFKYGIKGILKQSDVYNFYIHPWEFDPQQPRIKELSKSNYFRQYNNLGKTESRFTDMVQRFKFQSIGEYVLSSKKING
jgi:polysaccharide deacetylase family protein (PEP-CTERM system associated)